jgi:hypothetical protein
MAFALFLVLCKEAHKMITFTDARHTARMTRKEVATYLELTLATIKRYEQTGKAPRAVIECLLMIGGQCPEFKRNNSFTGWSFGNGYLWSPGGDRFTSGDVLARIYDRQLIRRLECDLVKAKSVFNTRHDNVIQFPISRIKKKLLA